MRGKIRVMSPRTVITLSTLIALGFATVIAVRIIGSVTDEPHLVAATAAPALTLPSETRPQAATLAAPAPARSPIVDAPQTSTSVGEAKGNIHFARQPSQKKEGPADRIDLVVRSALGVWQPGENLMRIVLLESPPASDDVSKLVRAVRSGSLDELAERRAVIELRFVPTAQAFDRNELDSATLIASDGTVTSAADALAGLDWDGSLPSPQLELPPGSKRPTVELTSGGNTESADRVSWQQKWHLSLAVPVVMNPVTSQ